MRVVSATNRVDFYVGLGTLLAIGCFGYFFIKSVEEEVAAKEELQMLSERLSASNKLLKEKDEVKSKMISIASHQFRSPLTAIKGYASLLKDESYGQVPDEMKTPINRILKSSSHLARIVNDFLNISRIKDQTLHYDFENVDIREVVTNVIQEAKGVLADEQSLHLSVEKTGSYQAKIDRDKFNQVLSNVVDNAIKYTPEGRIAITLDREDGNIVITIEDNGIGIDSENTNKIFEQFVRADKANDVNVTGSGLGLYIAKKIISDHNGSIWATSEGSGEGSTFHIRIPSTSPDTT
jgi:signal transduction histidine kinase